MNSVDLRFGRGHLTVNLPREARPTILRKPDMPVLRDSRVAVAEALDGDHEPSLAARAAGCRSACILICDITRPVPNGLFLRPMIERLATSGIPLDNIKVLVATGLHRPNHGDELAEVVGDRWVLENVEVLNHFAEDDAGHVTLGTTSKGTVVRLDRTLVEADLRIATGLVEPHFMAGYSGGRKVIAPGVAHAETITTFHNHKFMSHPHSANCILEGNPLHEEQLEIVEMLGGALALNTVIDEERRLSFVNFGEVVGSHLAAVEFVRRYAEIGVSRQFRTVVVSAAGYPLDKTYYQTVKGMVSPLDILAPGGDLIIASECSEGLGSDAYRAAQQHLVQDGEDQFLAAIERKSHADIDEWQTQMQVKPMRQAERVTLYAPALAAADRVLTGVDITDDIDRCIAESLERQGDLNLAIVPEGPYVIPQFQATGESTGLGSSD